MHDCTSEGLAARERQCQQSCLDDPSGDGGQSAMETSKMDCDGSDEEDPNATSTTHAANTKKRKRDEIETVIIDECEELEEQIKAVEAKRPRKTPSKPYQISSVIRCKRRYGFAGLVPSSKKTRLDDCWVSTCSWMVSSARSIPRAQNGRVFA